MSCGPFEIDLFSDNACRPTEEMRRFMAQAVVGDEEHGEDPTVRALESRVAELTGKPAAVFMPSGTMSNIVAYFVHCGREGEVLIHEDSHPMYSGYGGPAVPGRPLLRPLSGASGLLGEDDIARELTGTEHAIRLLSLENTHNRSGGSIWPLAALQGACRVARSNGLATHLDGARLLNAVAATGLSPAAYCSPFDSAWIDLSKGLGCPSGAVLVGSETFVSDARRTKYLFGGVLHKAGILAAAGIYALDHHVDRLQDDNAHAALLAHRLQELPGIELAQDRVETNIVYFSVERTGLDAASVLSFLAPHGIRLKPISTFKLRAVTHLDIREEHVFRVIDMVRTALATARQLPMRTSPR
jgi:threonine aldolase